MDESATCYFLHVFFLFISVSALQGREGTLRVLSLALYLRRTDTTVRAAEFTSSRKRRKSNLAEREIIVSFWKWCSCTVFVVLGFGGPTTP